MVLVSGSLFFFYFIFSMSLISRRHNCSQRRENMKMCRRYVQRARQRERERETAKKHNVCFFVSQLSIFQTPVFLPTLPSHQFLPPTALSSAKPLIRRYLLDDVLETLKKKKKECVRCLHTMLWTWICPQICFPSILSLSLSLSLYPSVTYMLHFHCCNLNSIYWAN